MLCYMCVVMRAKCVLCCNSIGCFSDINIRYKVGAVSTDICSLFPGTYTFWDWELCDVVSIVYTYCHNHMGCCFKCVLKLKR